MCIPTCMLLAPSAMRCMRMQCVHHATRTHLGVLLVENWPSLVIEAQQRLLERGQTDGKVTCAGHVR